MENEGGILVRSLNEIEVEALPQKLPKEIIVDISSLIAFKDNITVKNLKTEEGVEILTDPNIVVASVVPPRTQEEIEALDKEVEEKVEEIKVEEKGKKEEEEEEAREELKPMCF